MLKHIVPSQLRLGMYIHALDGSWLSHGFWKSSFKLKTTADLQRLQASGIAGLWIDLARGLDVQPAAAPAQPIATPAAPPAPSPCNARFPLPPLRYSAAEVAGTARKMRSV